MLISLANMEKMFAAGQSTQDFLELSKNKRQLNGLQLVMIIIMIIMVLMMESILLMEEKQDMLAMGQTVCKEVQGFLKLP
jgi:hypothetical protein